MKSELGSKTMSQKIMIDGDLCMEIRAADVLYKSNISVVVLMIEHHFKDAVDNVTGSPMFEGLISECMSTLLDWEELKTGMIKSIEMPEGKEIASWNLMYDTCEFDFMVTDVRMPVATFDVNEDVCHRIQQAHTRVDALREIQSTLLDSNRLDSTHMYLKSKVFAGMRDIFTKAEQEFDNQKKRMIDGVIPAEYFGHDWDLSYTDCKLSVY